MSAPSLLLGANFGSGNLSTSWFWRIPSIIQGVAPVFFLIVMLPFMPESPRFMLARGRSEEARKVLAEYHANGQLDDELVCYEIDEINTALAIERRYEEVEWSISWNTGANRKKMGLTISVFVKGLWYVPSLLLCNFHFIHVSLGTDERQVRPRRNI
jgi:hypothetical protein